MHLHRLRHHILTQNGETQADVTLLDKQLLSGLHIPVKGAAEKQQFQPVAIETCINNIHELLDSFAPGGPQRTISVLTRRNE